MRLSETLKTIRNKFIRKNHQTQPEDDHKAPEEMKVPEEKKEAEDDTEQKKEDENERLIRRYRAYSYYHKKKRIRKKYRKKLFEISPIDRVFYTMRETGCTAEELANVLQKMAEMGLLKQTSGWEKDHTDSRTRGGVR